MVRVSYDLNNSIGAIDMLIEEAEWLLWGQYWGDGDTNSGGS